MEVGLGSGGGSAPRGCSDESTVVSKVDSQEASSYAVEAELELELGLGLSLGGGGGKGKSTSGGTWSESGRILTAKDFPSYQLQSHNEKPSSCAAVIISGTKRAAADSVSSHDHQGGTGGSPTPANQVVGWPPIRAYRMNSLVNQAKSARADHEEKSAITDQNEKSKDVATVKKKICNGNEKGPLGFVKVNMDGTPIGRKVDLNAHGCYETLAQTLEEMFFKPSGTHTGGEKQQAMKHSKLLDGSSEFVLTYEDREGDWMLMGDVPWRMFLSSVKRLRVMRTSEANGLGRF